MDLLGINRGLPLALIIGVLLPVSGFAIDYESKIPHDKICMVDAISSNGEIYLQCKDTKSVLKTTVELPTLSEFEPTSNTKIAVERGKKFAGLKATWAMLDSSFGSRSYILLNFNADLTLITGASMYIGGGGSKNDRKKLDL